MTRTLTFADVTSLLKDAHNGLSSSDLARKYEVSRQSVEYQLEKNGFYDKPKQSSPPPGTTLQMTGTFWLYYNTQRGRPPAHMVEPPRPWGLRRIPDYQADMPSQYPEPDLKTFPEGEEILANQVTLVNGSAETRHYRNPIWINRRGDHIRYVRGFLVMEGTVEVKT